MPETHYYTDFEKYLNFRADIARSHPTEEAGEVRDHLKNLLIDIKLRFPLLTQFDMLNLAALQVIAKRNKLADEESLCDFQEMKLSFENAEARNGQPDKRELFSRGMEQLRNALSMLSGEDVFQVPSAIESLKDRLAEILPGTPEFIALIAPFDLL
jgi:hypothetical protein